MVLLGGISRAFYAQHQMLAKVQLQLQQLDQILAADNNDTAQATEGTLKGLQAQVVKNQKQPTDITLYGQAETFSLQADSLVRTLRVYRQKLLRTGTNPPTEINATPYSISRQLSNFELCRQQLNPGGSKQLTPADFKHLPPAVALARLTLLESEVRTTEIAALQQLTPKLGFRRLSGHLEAVATAEATAVAPGTIYRAKLYLAKPLDGLSVSMTCNGHPVPVAPNGQGLVRFKAPQRPGRASWVGIVHIQQYGRDSTFEVHVPYRVVRR
ncbi:hypothetical protein GCM10022409_04310 [Hymenobacter glaciei]|uniref:Gliding motility-associated protein GldM first immunoglobulin-like domain-containing protein n=2 Tax=Hymenobacter glaciei TaxID=877209 RepID=A0ABP7TAR3_9BACT